MRMHAPRPGTVRAHLVQEEFLGRMRDWSSARVLTALLGILLLAGHAGGCAGSVNVAGVWICFLCSPGIPAQPLLAQPPTWRGDSAGPGSPAQRSLLHLLTNHSHFPGLRWLLGHCQSRDGLALPGPRCAGSVAAVPPVLSRCRGCRARAAEGSQRLSVPPRAGDAMASASSYRGPFPSRPSLRTGPLVGAQGAASAPRCQGKSCSGQRVKRPHSPPSLPPSPVFLSTAASPSLQGWSSERRSCREARSPRWSPRWLCCHDLL